MRDRLAHRYFDTSHAILTNTVETISQSPGLQPDGSPNAWTTPDS
jgi:uncharacterized protein with HEPN domain